MKFRRIQFPGKTLVVSSLGEDYTAFQLYFLKFWFDRFGAKPHLALRTQLADAWAEPIELPRQFFSLLRFLFTRKYKTIIFLHPDKRADSRLKWLAWLLRIRHRIGFAPLGSISALNYSLPFNADHHHYIHQLKIFSEYLIGEKISQWQKPNVELRGALPQLPSEHYAVIALDARAQATHTLGDQFVRLINLASRDLRVVLMVCADTMAEARAKARAISETMTERAVHETLLVLNATEVEKLHYAREAIWVTGSDTQTLNLAAFAGVACLSLFGPINERVWQPFDPRARVLAAELSCRPCTKIPSGVVCSQEQPWQCLAGISAELILATLQAMQKRQAGKMPLGRASASPPQPEVGGKSGSHSRKS